MDETINLLNFDRKAMQQFFADLGEKPFRTKQVLNWVHQKGVTDFEQMTNLSKVLRHKLAEVAVVKMPEIVLRKPSQDGTRKWLCKMADGNVIETVFIPEDNRGTLCVSSQVGCLLTCPFCATGKQGFGRNLQAAEIIGQLWIAVRELSREYGDNNRSVTNVVMMGMGEPLMNFDNVVAAMNLMLDDDAYGLSRRRVTLSTSGVVPQIYALAEQSNVSLAISLHASDDALRNELVPINRKYPLSDLMAACQHYLATANPHKTITFEYVMLQGVNDTLEQAEALVALVKTLPCKINLIPFNTFPGTQYQCSSNNRIHRFKDILTAQGLLVTVRKTRGDDIGAACGQLVGQVKDITQRQEQYKKNLCTA